MESWPGAVQGRLPERLVAVQKGVDFPVARTLARPYKHHPAQVSVVGYIGFGLPNLSFHHLLWLASLTTSSKQLETPH